VMRYDAPSHDSVLREEKEFNIGAKSVVMIVESVRSYRVSQLEFGSYNEVKSHQVLLKQRQPIFP
jgi:hypothetical protein